MKTEEATAATSSFFMPYAAGDDDAAGRVEAGIESDYSDEESDDDGDSTEEEDQGELQFLNMGRERTAQFSTRLRPLDEKWQKRNA
jgi:hypothetical protein